MKPAVIHIEHTLYIPKPAEIVWDFTQDFSKRPLWDRSVWKVNLIRDSPNKEVEVFLKGNTIMRFRYITENKPHLSSLVAEDIRSPLIVKAGGTWKYEALHGGTKWTQKNIIELKPGMIQRWLTSPCQWLWTHQTRRNMERVKKILEKDSRGSSYARSW